MRTTITIDEDVAVELERIRRRRGLRLKEVLNQVLRDGLRVASSGSAPGKPIRIRTHDLGPALIGDVVSVSEALALAEGEAHR